jgi:hypothetical protein
MNKHLFLVAVLAGVLAASGVAAGSPSDPTVTATLTGKAEVPRGEPKASGTAKITLDPSTGKVCWVLKVKGLDTPVLGAYIHQAPARKNGLVAIPLGTKFRASGCKQAPKDTVAAVAKTPGAYYVNVHTHLYGNGAIRGQLHAG